MPKILSIVETAYRATIEEQDDTILWLSHSLKNAGADISILLRANAVNFAAKGQDASGLAFGDVRLTRSAKIDEDVERMIAKGIPVYVVQEDATERGLLEGDLISGINKITREGLAELIEQYDQVWHW